MSYVSDLPRVAEKRLFVQGQGGVAGAS